MFIPKILKIKKDNDKIGPKNSIKDYFFLILICILLCGIEIMTHYFEDDELCSLEGSEIIIVFIITSLFMKYKL